MTQAQPKRPRGRPRKDRSADPRTAPAPQMQIVECWQNFMLCARHRTPESWTLKDIRERYGLNHLWTIRTYPEGSPQQARTLQAEQPKGT